MPGLVLISLWVVMHVVQGFLASRALRDGKGDAALTISLLASAAPAAGLCLVLLIFVVGGASPTAQLNSAATRALWSLWVDVWPLAMFSLPLVLLVLLPTAACPPCPPRATASFLSRLAALNAGLCYAIFIYLAAPTA